MDIDRQAAVADMTHRLAALVHASTAPLHPAALDCVESPTYAMLDLELVDLLDILQYLGAVKITATLSPGPEAQTALASFKATTEAVKAEIIGRYEARNPESLF